MNLSSEITEYHKTPSGFYFDMNLTDTNNCEIVIVDDNFKSTLEINIHQIESKKYEDEDEEATQQKDIVFSEEYDCYCCIKNDCYGRTFTHDFHFSFFVEKEFNTYYVVNDHENCSDEYPVDDTYCQELSIFPEILKLIFMNVPKYVGYSI
jgi:hypothetical protein